MPECRLDSWAVQLQPRGMSVSSLEKSLRQGDPPLIGRIENDRFLLDVRTVQDREIPELCEAIIGFFSQALGSL